MNTEEFVNAYLQEHRHDVLLNPYNGLIDFANAFKEQMMEGAVSWLKDNAGNYWYDDFDVDCPEELLNDFLDAMKPE